MTLFQIAVVDEVQARSYLTHSYTEIEGLPSNLVNDITQDIDGRIWLATRNGVTCYDGLVWRSPEEESNKPAGVDLHFIKADRFGKIWTVGRGITTSYLENGQWVSLPMIKRAGILSQTLTGCSVSDREEKTIAVATSMDGAFVYTKGRWHHLGVDTGLPTDSISDVLYFGEHLLLATPFGLIALNQDLEQEDIPLTLLEFPTKVVGKLRFESMNPPDLRQEEVLRRIWIMGNPWLGYYENGAFHLVESDMKLIVPDKLGGMLEMQPDYAGGVICGQEAVLIHRDAYGGEQLLGEAEHLNANGSSGMFMDREFCLWIAGNRGVTKIPSIRFTNFTSEDGLLEDEVTAIHPIRTGSLLFGHNNGYSILKDSVFTAFDFTFVSPPPNDLRRVLDILQENETSYWFTVNSAGVYHLNLSDHSYKWYPEMFTELNFTSAVIQTETGDLLVAAGKGVYQYDSEKDGFVKSELLADEDLLVRAMATGLDGEIFLGTDNQGVIRIHNGVRSNWVSDSSPLANTTFSLFYDRNGTLFAATLDGPQIVKDNQLVPFREDAPFSHRPTYFIFRDRDGRLWLGTDNGVYIWDGSQSIHYTRIHGLAGLEANRKANFVDEFGRVWIGTSSGLSMYQRRYDFVQRIPDPEIRLLEIRSGQKVFPPSEEASFHANENTITATFSYISLIDESQNKFRYWLEGDGDGWSQLQPLRSTELRFANLSPGTYRLHIEACNALGKLSGKTTSAPITILPPIWRTWWFRFLMASTFLAATILIYRLFLQQRYATLLRNEVQEKTSELMLHRDRLEETVQQRTSELSQTNEALREEISKREVIQSEVERHHTHLESIFNGVHDAIVTVDSNGRITKANQGFYHLLTLGNRRVEGLHLIDLLPVEDVLQAVNKGREVRGWLTEVSERATGELLLKVNAQPLSFKDEATREIMIVMSDVTRLYQLQREVADRKSYHNIIGQNPKMQAVYSLIEDLSNTLATVLITGESGTGKELVAAALHHSSSRANGPFIALNCGSLSETILESELFGHVRGSFTSAVRDRAGRFEAARGGTLFLDEIGEMPMNMQVKLLRVLETGEFERVGDTMTLKTDARIISATNRDLLKRVDEGHFRKDLYYRLNVIHLHLPPLRERAEDIPLLVTHFIQMFGSEAVPAISEISPEALELLINSPWPGNVRELKHQVQRACLLCREGVLQPRHFRELVRSARIPNMAETIVENGVSEGHAVQGTGHDDEQNGSTGKRAPGRETLLSTLEQNDWNIQYTAQLLDISRQTIYRKIKEFNLKRPTI